MNCPFDGEALTTQKRTGIEIDWCPSCKGVWLERNELDKIIERSIESEPEPRRESARYDRDDRSPRYEDDDRSYKAKKKKTSFLSELFE